MVTNKIIIDIIKLFSISILIFLYVPLTVNGPKILKDITFIFTPQKCLSALFEEDNHC